MKHTLSWSVRAMAVASVTAVAAMWLQPAGARSQPQNPPAQLAEVEALKSKAFDAVRKNDLSQAESLLKQARMLSEDPRLAQMTAWIDSYEGVQHKVADDRKKDYDDAVSDVQKLIKAGHESFAADATARAFVHSADQDHFTSLPWVKDVMTQTKSLAETAEKDGNWLDARRLYGDLSAIEPTEPSWRKKVNDVNRHLILLSTYTPARLEAAYKKEADVRADVQRVIDPDKAPTTKPSDEAQMDDAFKLDWKQMLEGVTVDQLRGALDDAHDRYYRDVTYVELVKGGVNGLQELVDTKGLEDTFPSLGDDHKKQAFSAALKQVLADADNVGERKVTRSSLDALLKANSETLELPNEVLVYEFATGAMATLDPFSNVIWPSDTAEFLKSTQGHFSGVGIQIANDDDMWLKVITPIPDSPAQRAGIQPDDLITHINGKSAKGVTTSQAVKFITGPKGTDVTLTIKSPDGTSRDVVLTRDDIKVASIKGWTMKSSEDWDYLVDHDNGIGYVRVSNFSAETTKDLITALHDIKLEGGKAVILDLRNNPGGLLSSATEVVDQFIDHGVIVSQRSLRNNSQSPAIDARPSPDDVTLPMVVLVNQYSASASEIVSGALKDHTRALIVGERTYGKGSVQQLFNLNNNESFLKLTTNHYYLPSNRCIHREEGSREWGVEPDISVDVTPEQMRTMNKIRQDMDVWRVKPVVAQMPTTAPSDQLLDADPQLGAAVLMLRLELSGANLMLADGSHTAPATN